MCATSSAATKRCVCRSSPAWESQGSFASVDNGAEEMIATVSGRQTWR